MSAPAINRTPAHAMAAAAAAGASSARDVSMAPQWRGGPGGKAGDTLGPSPLPPPRAPRPSGPVPAALQSYLDQIEKNDAPDDAPAAQTAPTLPTLPQAPLGVVGSAVHLLGAIPSVIAAKLDEAATALDQIAQQSRAAAAQGAQTAPHESGPPGGDARLADKITNDVFRSDPPLAPKAKPDPLITRLPGRNGMPPPPQDNGPHGADKPDVMTLRGDTPPRSRPEGYVSKPKPAPEGALFSSDTDKPIMPPSLSALTSAPGLKKGETA